MSDVEEEAPVPAELAPPEAPVHELAVEGEPPPGPQYPRRLATAEEDGRWVVLLEVDNEEEAQELAGEHETLAGPSPGPNGWRLKIVDPEV